LRKKAEKKISRAVAELGQAEFYRIDKVRERAGIIRKVFDKTILDMARVGSIKLSGGSTAGMSPSEIGNLVRDGEELHVNFKFIDNETEPEALKTQKIESEISNPAAFQPQKVEIVLLEVEPETWQQFEKQCKIKENKSPVQKIQEMISDYISIEQ